MPSRLDSTFPECGSDQCEDFIDLRERSSRIGDVGHAQIMGVVLWHVRLLLWQVRVVGLREYGGIQPTRLTGQLDCWKLLGFLTEM